MDTVLVNVANRADSWSTTANELKSRLQWVRWIVFALSIVGALAAAIASQISEGSAGAFSPHTGFAILGVISLAAGAFFSNRLLGDSEVQAWVRARSAAEALKREAFKYAAGAKPFDDPQTASTLLDEERAKIEQDIDDLDERFKIAKSPGSSPRQALTRQDYRQKRIVASIDRFYRPKAEAFRQTNRRLRVVEFVLALAATLITGVAGALGGKTVSLPFDIAALTAVLTTISGAILAHVEAQKYDYLVATYLATARRLQDQNSRFPDNNVSAGDWSAFVSRCEDIIAAENSSWISKWTKQQP